MYIYHIVENPACYILDTDLTEAFGTVDRLGLWALPRNNGCLERFGDVLYNIHVLHLYIHACLVYPNFEPKPEHVWLKFVNTVLQTIAPLSVIPSTIDTP